jgi:uridine kinase
MFGVEMVRNFYAKSVAFCLFLIPFCVDAQVVLIGIAGGTGSGKTTLAQQLKKVFGDDVAIISQDSYYNELGHLSKSERDRVNFDHPNSLDFGLLREHLQQLKSFAPVNVPNYDFTVHTRTAQTTRVEPRHVVIVEGILLFAAPEVKDLFDVRIFVEADSDLRILRRIDRDMKERGRDFASVSLQYQTTVKPMHDLFVESCRQYAHLIVPGNRDNSVAVDTLVAKIRADLDAAALLVSQ